MLKRKIARGYSAVETVTIGFMVKFVVCHKENGSWVVCKECTAFEYIQKARFVGSFLFHVFHSPCNAACNMIY